MFTVSDAPVYSAEMVDKANALVEDIFKGFKDMVEVYHRYTSKKSQPPNYFISSTNNVLISLVSTLI